MSPRAKDDETPLDDAANFPIKRRQARLRGKKDTLRKMNKVREEIDAHLRVDRDRTKYVEET